MATEISSFDRLFSEFSHIKVIIEFGSQSFLEGNIEQFDNTGAIEYPENYEFYIKFQSEKEVYCFTYLNINDKYLSRLEKLRFKFYKGINNYIVNSSNDILNLNLLSDYKIRFVELLENYFDYSINVPDGIIKLKDNKKIQYHYSEQRPFYDFDRARILHYFLIAQIETIEKIISYLDEKIILLKGPILGENGTSISNHKIKGQQKKYYTRKSFNLNTGIWESDSGTNKNFKLSQDALLVEKLKDFRDSLLKSELITSINIKYVIQIFKNQDIIQPIVWKGTPSELYYLIKNLHDRKLIIQFNYFWIVACNCFLAYNKRSKVCTPKYLQRCKPPKRPELIRKLDAVLNTLK